MTSVSTVLELVPTGVAAHLPFEVPAPEDVSPGITGFLVTFAIAVVVIGLFLSLTRHMRVVDRRARQRDAAETAAQPAAGHPVASGLAAQPVVRDSTATGLGSPPASPGPIEADDPRA